MNKTRSKEKTLAIVLNGRRCEDIKKWRYKKMDVNINKKTINAKLDQWDFEADYITENSIKIFVYGNGYWGNRFIGFYNPKNEEIRPLYYNKNIDYRNGWKPSERQTKQIKKYCNKLINKIGG